jgi:hypothetical protein
MRAIATGANSIRTINNVMGLLTKMIAFKVRHIEMERLFAGKM